ncbi:hypothetical protein PAXINDRAFT_15850 [Paxillus involutus ATCC 200175]|uniref:Unplaced genomic scaffold PAXINscaffold_62, whole genome shotgun sequence n=1 Tax=Paxillus involutus ATCC 200175 TaxID=664439 RepID=A0A0C9TKP2_PAXIN|nr:hypothetical protein PAXINDRAFT_15850 [Paxillus involutus ATCC 200175]
MGQRDEYTDYPLQMHEVVLSEALLDHLGADEKFETGDIVYQMTYEEADSTPTLISPSQEDDVQDRVYCFKVYKPVDHKVKSVPGIFPQEAAVVRQFPYDPLESLPPLTPHPPSFTPSNKITKNHIDEIQVNKQGFLWPEEEKVFQYILLLNEELLAFEDVDRETFK